MNPIVYFNGDFVPSERAHINIRDSGWLHGAGLFETMRAENGTVFRLDAHLRRLRNSAETLLHPLDESRLPNADLCRELLRRMGLSSAKLRLTVSGGFARADSAADELRPTVCLTAAPLSEYPAEYYQKGISAAICEFRTSPSDPLAGHKTTAYLPRLLGLRDAQRVRCAEALWFTTTNQLAEACISNVFVLKEERLLTPPLHTPVLPGITRGIILEVAQRLSIKVGEESLTIHDVLDAEEVFLTNTMMQVLPVVRVEKRDIGGGAVGPIARRLLNECRSLVRAECSPASTVE